jgi:hypothetical protein
VASELRCDVMSGGVEAFLIVLLQKPDLEARSQGLGPEPSLPLCCLQAVSSVPTWVSFFFLMKIKDHIIQESKADRPTRQNKPWLGAGVRLAAEVEAEHSGRRLGCWMMVWAGSVTSLLRGRQAFVPCCLEEERNP